MMIQRNALAISGHTDSHIPFVQPYFNDSFIVIDPTDISQGNELTFAWDKQGATIHYDGQILSNVSAVWYRKPTRIRELELSLQDEYKEYSLSGIERLFSALRVSFQDALWISDYYAIQRAENKSLQQIVAGELGFNVPDTLMTSSAAAVRRFREKHNTIVVKPLSLMPLTPDGRTTFPTTKIARGDELKLEGLHYAPSIFQQAIDAQADLRITVVGSDVHAAIIQDEGIAGFPEIRDWRLPYAFDNGEKRFEKYELKPAVRKACVELVRKLGLQFGAIDLVMDRKGKIWFLEINANGQWAFIEDDTGQPIGKSIAELIKKHTELR
jgi:glutathione synthase/RimK-type ligase-like ATP-grasp enzyme